MWGIICKSIKYEADGRNFDNDFDNVQQQIIQVIFSKSMRFTILMDGFPDCATI